MFSIGVRYCGGCNPRIDRSRVVKDLKAGLEDKGLEVDFTTDRERPVDLVLLINGCMHACLEAEYHHLVGNQQLICVRGEMVHDQYVEERRIPQILIGKILELLPGDMRALGRKGGSLKGEGRRG